MSHRWMKFWPGDWKSDAALRMCGLAARGLWIECISIMHDAAPYGHLLVNGRALTPRQLAAIVGSTERETSKLLAELEAAGVFSRIDDGTIFSRRMVRDAGASQKGIDDIEKRWGGGDGKSRAQRLSDARKKGKHNAADWIALCGVCASACLKCGAVGEELVKDHITPLYLGGSDAIENIQPLCRSCNAAKSSDATDYRPNDWENAIALRIKRLGFGVQMPEMTPSLDTEADTDTEREVRTPIIPHANIPADGQDRRVSATPSKARKGSAANPHFDAWWKAYPRKVGKDYAERAYTAAVNRGATHAELAHGLQSQCWSTDPQFIPHAATWLNGGRWKDDPNAAAPGPAPVIGPREASWLAMQDNLKTAFDFDATAEDTTPW